MSSDRSHSAKPPSAKGPSSPSPRSRSLVSSKATISKSVTTNPAWPSSPSSDLKRNSPEVYGLGDPDSHPGVSVADPTTPKPPIRLVYLPTPPETPEQLSVRPKSEAQTRASGLAILPGSPGKPSPRPLSEEHIIQDKESSAGLCILETTTPKPATSKPASPELSTTGSVQSSHQELTFPDSDPYITWRFFPLLSNTLASLGRRRARAREGRIKGILSLIRQIHDEEYPGTQLLIRRTLYSSEYRELLDRVEADSELDEFFYNGLRFDYSHADNRFIIRMASTLHDTFTIEVNKGIQRFLDEHASSQDDRVIARIARDIHQAGARKIYPPKSEFNGKRPDSSFQLRGRPWPGLVVEVAWAQDKLEMKEKAEFYFDSTQGEVRTVVGFNLNDIYKKQQAAEWKSRKGKLSTSSNLTFLAPAAAATSASFSVWRAKLDPSTGKTIIGESSNQEQIFRYTDQQHNPDVSLELSLEDFVCKAAADKLCIEEEGGLRKIEYPQLKISSKLLCNWLEIAVDLNRPEWEQDQERKVFQRRKKEDAKLTAQRKEAAALEEEVHKSSIRARFGRFRNLAGRLRSERHRKAEEEGPPGPGGRTDQAIMSGANSGV